MWRRSWRSRDGARLPMRVSRVFTASVTVDFANGPIVWTFAAVQEKNLCEMTRAIGRFNWRARESQPVMDSCRPRSVHPAPARSGETLMSQPEPNVDEVVRSIAEETDTPAETVSRMYADT